MRTQRWCGGAVVGPARGLGALAALACGVLAVACTDAATTQKPGGELDAGPAAGPATALFELPRGGAPTSEFYALPFPNDLRRTADGKIDLSGLTPYVQGGGLLEEYLQIFSKKLDGFGTNEAVFFRFSSELDPASLPATPADSVGARPSVYLVDVDPASPERGKKIPLKLRFEKFAGSAIGPDWLSCLPFPGFPLRGRTTYAAVVTTRVKAADGSALKRSADLEAVLAPSGGDAAVAAARGAYQPLLTWLDGTGADSPDARADVAAAAVFTTQDPTSFMTKLRAVVYTTPEPAAKTLVTKETATAYQAYEGTYEAPNFQSGAVPYLASGGEILIDEAGVPKIDHTETLRFALTVPRGKTMPDAGWPIVLYSHGTGGDYRSFISDGTAGRLAAQGLASISIDQVLHGPRDPTGHNPENTFFNFSNPLAARDNVRQGAVDNFQLLRLAAGLKPGGAAFDAAKIAFFGHSQGGLSGPPFLAVEPRVKAAVLSGAAGLIYLSLLNKTEPVNIPALVMTQIRDVPLDEFNPMLALIQMFIEVADPVNYGPLLVRQPLPGIAPKDIYQCEGFVDHYAPDPGIEAFGVSIGLVPVTPVLHDVPGFALRGAAPAAPPVMGNLEGRTGVFAQYDAGSTGDGHFVVFRVDAARRQSAQFLGTLFATGVATLVP